MTGDNSFLEDVGMENVPFPMRVLSKTDPDGQPTIAKVSISARIMQEFEAQWINRFMQILHMQQERLGAKELRANVFEYLDKLHAKAVRIDLEYPFFMEKITPVSKEKRLERYLCTCTAKASEVSGVAINFKIQIPVITTYPDSAPDKPGGLFGQLSIVTVEIASEENIYPEDLVELVDSHAIIPVHSFLTEEDQQYLIQKVHSIEKTSVELVDEIRKDLASNPKISWYSVNCANYGMLHSYSTIIGIEKSSWIPFS